MKEVCAAIVKKAKGQRRGLTGLELWRGMVVSFIVSRFLHFSAICYYFSCEMLTV